MAWTQKVVAVSRKTSQCKKQLRLCYRIYLVLYHFLDLGPSVCSGTQLSPILGMKRAPNVVAPSTPTRIGEGFRW